MSIPLAQTPHGLLGTSKLPVLSHTHTKTNHPIFIVLSTVCNSTYGCCGCDNCQGFNNLTNVPARLDTFRNYQNQLNLPPKVLWGTPQAFPIQDFWTQTPTPSQEVAMTMLSINHGAKGIIMWTFPTTAELTDVTSRLARVLTSVCAKYILGADIMTEPAIDGANDIDVSAWKTGNSILVSIVNSAYENTTGPISVSLPGGLLATSITQVLWGDGGWHLTSTSSASHLERSGIQSLSTDILILSLSPSPEPLTII